MKTREHIEGDLIQITARLHDLALCGIGTANLNEVRRLSEAVNILIREADAWCPQIVKFPILGGELARCGVGLESRSDG